MHLFDLFRSVLSIRGAVALFGLLCFISAPLLAQRPVPPPTPQQDGEFGKAVSAVGDLNDDDVPDLIVGAPSEDVDDNSAAGRAYVMSGRDGHSIRTFTSPNRQVDGHFGRSVTALADLNGNGTPEVAVGAPMETVEGTREGRVYVFDGATEKRLFTFVSTNGTKRGRFGATLAAPGDLTGDGTEDLLVGASGEGVSPQSGRVYAFDGSDGSHIRTMGGPMPTPGMSAARGYFGAAVAGVEDINGDDVPDVLVGAPGQSAETEETTQKKKGLKSTTVDEGDGAGRAHLFSGASGELLLSLSNPDPNSDSYGDFGAAVTGIDDVSGDDVPDLLVGAPDGAGRVLIFSGANGKQISTLKPKDADGLMGAFGSALATLSSGEEQAGPRVVVGAPEEIAHISGSRVNSLIYVFASETLSEEKTDADPLRIAPSKGVSDKPVQRGFGTSLASIGDLNADGRPDLAVGHPRRTVTAPGDTTNGAGEVHLYRQGTDELPSPNAKKTASSDPGTQVFQPPDAPAGFTIVTCDWPKTRLGTIYPSDWAVVDLFAKTNMLTILDLSRKKGTAKKRWAGSHSFSSEEDDRPPVNLFGPENASIFVIGGLLATGGRSSASLLELLDVEAEKDRLKDPTVIHPPKEERVGGHPAATVRLRGTSGDGHTVTYDSIFLRINGTTVAVKILRPSETDVLSDEAVQTVLSRLTAVPKSS